MLIDLCTSQLHTVVVHPDGQVSHTDIREVVPPEQRQTTDSEHCRPFLNAPPVCWHSHELTLVQVVP
jgi:hypothetical protein